MQLHDTSKAASSGSRQGGPVAWEMTTNEGKEINSYESTWDMVSSYQTLDGLRFPFTQWPLTKLTLFFRDQIYQCIPPQPCPFFGYSRWANGLQDTPLPQWKYTLFGYCIDTTFLHLFRFSPDTIDVILHSRIVPFPL